MANIDRVAMELWKLGVALEQEEDAAGFLGVKMERDSNTGLLEMKQTGLIERVVEALGLDDGYARGKHTPAETCRKPPSYVPYKGTYVPYDGTFGAPDQGQTLDV